MKKYLLIILVFGLGISQVLAQMPPVPFRGGGGQEGTPDTPIDFISPFLLVTAILFAVLTLTKYRTKLR